MRKGKCMQEVKQPNKKPFIFYYMIALIVIILINSLLVPQIVQRAVKEVDYNTFMQMTYDKQIDEVQIQDNQIVFTAKNDKTIYKTGLMDDPDRTQRLYDSGAKFSSEIVEEASPILSFLISWLLPLIIIIGFGQLMYRQMAKKAGGDSMMFGMGGMGKSNAKVYVKSSNGIKFTDVAGEDEAKENLTEIVEYLHDPDKYKEIGASMPKGILLVGPPGTGKTMLAKAVAGEANVPFFSMSGSEFVEMFVGMGASKVRDLFKQAKEKAPCIVFIDEIDAIGKKRDGQVGGNDEREQTLNQLLTEMDGFEGNNGVIILAATNRPESLDPALLRPGRFDRQVYVNYPDIKGREEILKVHSKNKPLAPDVDLKQVAAATAGFTGADLANLINEAALMAVKADRKAITAKDLSEASIKVIAGPEKKSRVVLEQEKKLTPYHEAGHAICHYYCPTQDKVSEVSIIPRGQAGGYTMALPDHDKSYASKSEMTEEIVTLLGGRAAEKVVLDDISTGASNDLERATKIARSMVTKYGFSDKLGPIVYGRDEDEVFLGRDYNSDRSYSEVIAGEIDAELRSLIHGAYDKAIAILSEHIDQLHTVAKYLISHEKINGDQFERLMKGEDLDAQESAAKEAEESIIRQAVEETYEEAHKEDSAKNDSDRLNYPYGEDGWLDISNDSEPGKKSE